MTTPSAAKYQDYMTGATWNGRGLQPKWMRVALANGARLSDFEVAAAAAADPDSAPGRVWNCSPGGCATAGPPGAMRFRAMYSWGRTTKLRRL